MATLLLAEVVGGALSDMTARALTAALEIGQPVDVLVAGHNVGTAVEAAAKLAGVAKVRVADDPVYAHALAEPTAALIVSLAPGYDAIVAPSTASAKNIAPRGGVARRDAGVRHHQGGRPKNLRAADLRRQRHPDGRGDRSEDRGHRAHRRVQRDRAGRPGPDRDGRGRRRPGRLLLRRRGAGKVGPAGAHL